MKKQPTREKLLDITFDEVYIYGYTATSVDGILKKAGIPKCNRCFARHFCRYE